MKAYRNLIFMIASVLVWAIVMVTIFPDPVAAFMQNWIYIPVGFGAALIGNISAVGGGIIFIPAMIFLFHMSPVESLKIAIGSQSIGMTSGALAWSGRAKLPWSLILIALPGIILGSAVSTLVIHPNALLIKMLFGPVSVLLGCLTIYLLISPRSERKTIDKEFIQEVMLPLFIVSFIGGMITGWIAIGEGEVASALLMLAYGLEASTCIALGVVLLSINSIFLALLHTAFLNGIPWNIVCFTGIGCVFGAQFAIWVSRWAKQTTLKFVFAIIVILDGLLFIWQSTKLIH